MIDFFGLHTHDALIRSTFSSEVCSLPGDASCFLKLNKPAVNHFGTWRFPSIYVKNVLNGYDELELGKLYDAFGYLLNGHHCTDCVRHAVLLLLREFSVHVRAHVQQARNKNLSC
jgi:hypothetical protein